ncbi:hypothetical protein GALL_302380 [mine drainage metagenome]|jgi:hypothetical protein|uniref:Lipoprotein n=1 Tax=mine drainage metagenome TaxID=410659 RepID=A0A1J5QX62_9ZZZZ
MHTRRLSWMLCAAALAGCAHGGVGAIAPEPAGVVPAPGTSAAAVPAPSAASAAAPAAPGEIGVTLAVTPIGDMLRRVGGQTQAAADADEQRLRALGTARSALQRVHLAYLLMARAAPSVEQANQALELLAGLDQPSADAGARQFVRVLQRLARQTLQLAQQRAELGRANRQIADLQDKITQIKNLEVQLQDRRKQGQTP